MRRAIFNVGLMMLVGGAWACAMQGIDGRADTGAEHGVAGHETGSPGAAIRSAALASTAML